MKWVVPYYMFKKRKCPITISMNSLNEHFYLHIPLRKDCPNDRVAMVATIQISIAQSICFHNFICIFHLGKCILLKGPDKEKSIYDPMIETKIHAII